MLVFRKRRLSDARLLVLLIAGCSLLSLDQQRAQAQVPQSDHVFLLVLENHSYEQVIGNSVAPYLNSLAQSYGVAANYDANSHYSIPNYFWLTTGAYVTTSDGTTQTFNVDNIIRYLLSAGKTWKAYEESIPYAGYTGPSTTAYGKNHDPFAYLTDVVNSSQKLNIVPFTQLAADITNGALPNYGFITPNETNDGHNGNLGVVDQWLKTNIAALLASPPFQAGGNGILIITFDESVDSDCRPLTSCPPLPENHGGGRVATLVISPMAKAGYKSATFYQHPSVLKTLLLALGIASAPGAAQSAPAMADFFTGSSSNTLSVFPAGLTYASQTVGSSSSPQTVTVTNNNAGAAVALNSISASGDFSQTNNCGSSLAASASCTVSVTFNPTAAGARTGTLTLADSAGNSPQTVALSGTGSSSSGCVGGTVNQSVTICSPAAGQTVSSPVHIVATTTDSKAVQFLQIYLDGVKKYQVAGASLDTSLAMTAGTHRLTVQAYDGINFKQTIYITVQ